MRSFRMTLQNLFPVIPIPKAFGRGILMLFKFTVNCCWFLDLVAANMVNFYMKWVFQH